MKTKWMYAYFPKEVTFLAPLENFYVTGGFEKFVKMIIRKGTLCKIQEVESKRKKAGR